jgi:carbamoylphosphate synthase large subunit
LSKKILVTGVGGASGMYTTKILKETGYYVVGTDANGFAAGSVLCDEFCVVNKASNRGDFVKDIRRLLERFEIDVVLPNVDEELMIFAEEDLKAIISSPDTIYTCINKYMFYTTLRDDFLLPHTELVSKVDYNDRLKFNNKVIVKPMYGRGSKNIYVFDDIKDVIYVKTPMSFNYGYIVQEYIEGYEITVDTFISKDGNVFIAPRYRIHTYGGVSQVGRTVHHVKALKASRAICNHLDFYGPINIQFIEEKRTKKLYLTEINPRLSGGIGITYANGANIPDMAIQDHFGEGYLPTTLRYDLVFRIFEEHKDENTHRD